MLFDSHVQVTLGVLVGLANRLTPGLDGGHGVAVPEDSRQLRAAVADVLAACGYVLRRDPTADDAELIRDSVATARTSIESIARGDLAAAARHANDLLGRTGARPQLDVDDTGRWNLHFHGPDDSLGVGWAAGIAAGLAMALGTDDAGRLGVCGAEACDRVYLDTSRNGGRRFCSTRCQNRVKAAAHRARTASRA